MRFVFRKEQVVDSYKDYSTGFPHTKSISGYGDSAYVDVRQKLYEKQRQIQQEIAFLEDWLDSVEDPELRDIFAIAVCERTDPRRDRRRAGV